MFAVGTKVVFEEPFVRVRDDAAVSASPTVNASAPVLASSLIVWLAISEIVGGSFTAVTVMVTVAVLESAVPSFALYVKESEPL